VGQVQLQRAEGVDHDRNNEFEVNHEQVGYRWWKWHALDQHSVRRERRQTCATPNSQRQRPNRDKLAGMFLPGKRDTTWHVDHGHGAGCQRQTWTHEQPGLCRPDCKRGLINPVAVKSANGPTTRARCTSRMRADTEFHPSPKAPRRRYVPDHVSVRCENRPRTSSAMARSRRDQRRYHVPRCRFVDLRRRATAVRQQFAGNRTGYAPRRDGLSQGSQRRELQRSFGYRSVAPHSANGTSPEGNV